MCDAPPTLTAHAASPVPIAVVVGSWLPQSETFVYDLIRQQQATRAWVIAGARSAHGGELDYHAVTVLGAAQRLGYLYTGRAARFERALEQSGARLAFAHFGLNGAFSLPFVRRRGLPLAVMFHGHDAGGLLPCNRFAPRYLRYQRLSRELFGYSSLLLCASAELAELLVACGAPHDKLRVHHLGVDVDAAAPAARSATPLVLMVGRLVEKKGMSYGLQAFARLLARVPAARLQLIGDGPLRARLVREARALGIAGATWFRGSLPHREVLTEMSRAHVLMTPSVTTARGDRESGVLVVKEAAARGLAIVATQHGGIPEIIEHERSGLLVPERAVDALAGALERLVLEPGCASALGAAARQRARSAFDQRVQARTLERHLLSLL